MKLTRRKFLIGAGVIGGGLVIAISLRRPPPVPGLRQGTFQPNAYLQITPDNQVIFQMARAEMGQGVYAGMTTIIGEELDFDPARITVELAGVHPDFSLGMGQVTGGSMSVAMGWDPIREAGALARALLIKAAARRWGTDEKNVATNDGVLINRTNGGQLLYGDLVEDARQLNGDTDYELKELSEYRWIGKSAPRNDALSKSTGKARFGIDVDFPDIRIAVVVRPPQFGGWVKSWNAEVAREIPGVEKIFEIHSGVAIVARSYWEARRAAAALKVEWFKGPLAGLDSDTIMSVHRQALANGEARIAAGEGDIESGFASAAQVQEAEYSAPFLPHNTMEPQNATALVRGDSIEMWVPSQGPDMVRNVVSYYTGVATENITVHSTFLGGGFGRRAFVDFAGEAAVIAQQTAGTPVKVIWSREDDIQHDFYRPASLHSIKAALDNNGNLLAWRHKVVSSSIIKSMALQLLPAMLPAFVPADTARSLGRYAGNIIANRDPTTTEGAEVPYTVPNLEVSQVLSEQGIPVGFWRSVGHSHTAFVSESFMDEMAHAAGADPVEFRRRHLQDKPRHRAVLDLAAEKAGWGDAAAGIYQGVAVHQSFNTYVATVVEISITGKQYRVERVVSAVDCGIAVTPDIIRAQVRSSIVYGLSGAMHDPVTIQDGAVKQSNFHDAPVLRITEAPKMEVYIVDSKERPTGIGEPGLPPLAPALANALFAASGQRLRELPLKLA